MFFWFKRKEVVIDLFTYDFEVYEKFKIKPSKYHFPEWWKKLPSYDLPAGAIMKDRRQLNMRYCSGFIDFYKQSLALPMWRQVEFKITTDNYEWVSNEDITIVAPNKEQFAGLLPEHNLNICKINTPWAFSSKKNNIDLLIVDNIFSKPSPNFIAAPGILPGSPGGVLNIIFIVKHTESEETFTYAVNEPLVHFVPLTDKKVRLKYHMIEFKKFDMLYNKHSTNSLCKRFLIDKKINELANHYNSTLKK